MNLSKILDGLATKLKQFVLCGILKKITNQNLLPIFVGKFYHDIP